MSTNFARIYFPLYADRTNMNHGIYTWFFIRHFDSGEPLLQAFIFITSYRMNYLFSRFGRHSRNSRKFVLAKPFQNKAHREIRENNLIK